MHNTIFDLPHDHTYDYISEYAMQILHKLEMHSKDEEEYGYLFDDTKKDLMTVMDLINRPEEYHKFLYHQIVPSQLYSLLQYMFHSDDTVSQAIIAHGFKEERLKRKCEEELDPKRFEARVILNGK